MITKILITVAALIALLLVVVAMQPSEFRVSRSVAIAAPPAAVFAQVNDLHQWEKWSPWAELDPAMKQSYSGPASGLGASYTWEGNDKVGAGRSTIVESRPDTFVRFSLEFKKPFEGRSTAEFTFKPEGSGTLATWTMYGPKNFIGKAMGLVMDCETMCGDQFNKGLASLKALSEAPTTAQTK